MSTDPKPRIDARPLALGLAAACLYLFTAPGVVNGDGLGYLKLLPHNFAAGHLLYMPLLRAATRLLGGDGLAVGRLLDAVLGGTGVLLTYDIARRFAPLSSDRRFVATVAAAGLAVSFGYWSACADVEAYALATVALLALVRVSLSYPDHPSAGRALLMGVLLAVAVLTHVTHVLACGFVIAVCLEDPRGRKHALPSAALALGTGGFLSAGAYVYAAFVVRGHHADGALRWVMSASHGFVEPTGAYSFASSVYGACRSLSWSPALEGVALRGLLAQLALGLVLVVVLVTVTWRHRTALRDLPLRALAAIALPYVLFALVFFGADTERWIFLLPLGWILVAVALDATSARVRWAFFTVAYLASVNFAFGMWPAHRDVRDKERALRAAAVMSDAALVVFPGHAWDEYVSFYGGSKHLEPFPVSYYLARDGEARMWSRLDREVGAAQARGHSVYAMRMLDAQEPARDPAGWVEMQAIGVPRNALEQQLRARYVVTPVLVSDEVSVVQLAPR